MHVNKSFLWKMVLPVPIVVVIGLVVAWALVPGLVKDNARQSATEAALQTANQFKIIRGYYTKNIIGPAKASGALKPSIEHAGDNGAIPLPATMIQDLSALLAGSSTTMSLYSPFPFPNRGDRVLDDFQQSAWEFLSANPEEVFKREEVRDGVTKMRVAIADTLTAPGCVACHNSFVGTPKNDWELGDVRGILEIDADISTAIAAAGDLNNKILLGVFLAGVIILVILLASARAIAKPIQNITRAMGSLAGGEMDTEVPALERVDEIGQMASAVEVLRQNGLKIQRLEKETEGQLLAAADHSGQISAIGKAQAVIEFTLTGEITNANENFLAVTGYSLDEIVGKHHSMFVDTDYARSTEYKAFWHKLGKGEYEAGEYKRFGKNGAMVWIHASYNPIFDPDGNPVRVVKYATDVTQRKQATEALSIGLKRLADGDLTSRIERSLSGEFEEVRVAFNDTVDRLTEIVGQLRDTSGGLKMATGEILTGANDLSERTTKQAATIEETSASMEQLAATVTENAKKAEDASAKSGAVSKVAREGGEVMVEANNAMERITQSSAKISNIIGMIDDIAFQTNLLALNASVEAARAGEAGKGFAVVAVEVRRLAQSAAKASSEVKTLIEQSASEVSGGSKLVADAAEKLDTILGGVRESGKMLDEIARDSKEQASSIAEVNDAVRQMDEMTQHNAALVEETNAAIEQTDTQVDELDKVVDVFKLNGVGGHQSATPLHTPQAKPADGDARALQGKVKKAAKSYLSEGSAAVDSEWSEF